MILAQALDPAGGLPTWVTAGGALSVLGWLVYLLISRRLITAGTYQEMKADRDEYKAAIRAEQQARQQADATSAAAVQGLAAVNSTVASMLRLLEEIHADIGRRGSREHAG